jgi:diguanylate cyclase (GGDEF)-like protein
MTDHDPDGRPAPEVLHEDAHSRVTRIRAEGGSVLRKEALGPGRLQRIRHELAILRRLEGVRGVAQPAQPGPTRTPPGSLVLADPGGRLLADVSAPLDRHRLARLAFDLARTLGALHGRGVIHRDVSPASVLLSATSEPYLIDVGLATTVSEIHLPFGHPSEIVGTLAYLAPEQTGRTGQPVDQRADLYTLGATLYQAATGSPPFSTGDPVRLLHDHLARRPVPPVERRPEIGAALSAVIMHLLEKEPDSRYQSADGLVHDLTRLVDGAVDNRSFPIGERDFPARLISPGRLVGRRRDVAALGTALRQAQAGQCRGVFVSGPPGVGKSALLKELRPLVTAANGRFVAGKFDPYRQDREFDGVSQAFHALGRLLLAEPEDELAGLRHRLRDALGPDAGLIAAIHPTFAALLQVRPDPAISAPLATQSRMERSGIAVLRQVASPQRPLVFVVDDLQWAGRTPLAFLDQVMREERLDGLLVVTAFRDEGGEDETYPLAALLSRWQRLQVPLQRIRLENLPADGVAALLADVLHLPGDQVAELADLIMPATAGNPYAAIDLLNSLRHDGLLAVGAAGWHWDAAALRHRLAHTDVAHLLAERSGALPAGSRALVQAMSCLGGRVELELLATALGASAPQAERRLQPALEDGLLVLEPGPPDAVSFRHDRVQEIILRRLGTRRERTLRQRLAQRLADRPDLFAAAAHQYLLLIEAGAEVPERPRAAALLHRYAEQARLMSNFALMDRCLAAVVAVTDPADTDAMIRSLAGRHLALFSQGRLDKADDVYQQLDRLCGPGATRTDLTLVQISSLTNRNQLDEALRLGQGLLRQLGSAPPPPDRLPAEVEHGLDELYEWVGAGDPDDTDRPELTDPRLLATGAVIGRMIPAAYYRDLTLMAWLVLRAGEIWRRHGPGRTLVGPLGSLPYVTIGRRQDFRTGYQMLRHVIAVGQSRKYEPETSQARFLYALGGWSVEPLEDGVRLGRQARDGLIQGGDLQNAGYSYYATAFYLLDCASTLEEAQAEIDAGLRFARRVGNDQAAELFAIYRRLVGVLRGESDESHLSALGVPEQYGDNRINVASLHVARGVAAAVFGDQAELVRHTAAAMPALPTMAGTYLTAAAYLLSALASAEQARAAPAADRDVPLDQLDQAIDWIAARADDAPYNFLHLLRLVEAERAWARDDFRAASFAFDAAAREAASRQRPWHRALILERAGRFWLAHGMASLGHTLLGDARRAYLAYGAAAKVDQLRWAYPTLTTRPAVAPSPAGAAERPSDLPPGSGFTSGAVDLLGIIASSQALSSETSVDGLRERVSEVLRNMTGATNVRLQLRHDGEPSWLALTPGGSGEAATAAAGPHLPASALRYVERTGDPLVVSDATQDDRFSRDPYFAGLDCCSLLVLPVRHQGSMEGLLVLENRLLRGAFTAERLEGVNLIAGQLAVSLHNAMVYASMERMVADRTDELARANERLSYLTFTDALTGLANRRRLQRVLSAEWRRARRAGRPIALAMVDIDHFKRYNDEFGHVAGDRCLQRVATLLDLHARADDLAARYGGEEFAIVMPGTDLDTALGAADRLRAAVEALGEPHPLVDERVVTVSVGVAALVPPPSSGVRHLTELADAELYLAKQTGRNRVMPTRS